MQIGLHISSEARCTRDQCFLKKAVALLSDALLFLEKIATAASHVHSIFPLVSAAPPSLDPLARCVSSDQHENCPGHQVRPDAHEASDPWQQYLPLLAPSILPEGHAVVVLFAHRHKTRVRECCELGHISSESSFISVVTPPALARFPRLSSAQFLNFSEKQMRPGTASADEGFSLRSVIGGVTALHTTTRSPVQKPSASRTALQMAP